jgi:type I restriction enzyme S subunit
MAKLSDVAAINPPRKVKKGELVPFVEMAALPLSGRDVSASDVEIRISKAAGAHFQNGDTLLARITPCLENGKTAQVNVLPDKTVGEGSTEFIVLCGHDSADNDFVYYLCREPEFRKFAISRMEGTSGRQRVAWQSIAGYPIELPSPDVRRDAADFLATLDDRIDNLRQTNATLEAIAAALFKSRFVDFDGVPPEGMQESELGLIPKGWRVGSLGESFDVNPRRELKKGTVAPYLDMASLPTAGAVPDMPLLREFSSGTKFINGDTLLARITPCLENGKTAFVDFLEEGQVGWGSTEFIVLRPEPPLPSFFGYLLARRTDFREHAIRAMSGTSGRQRVEVSQLHNFKLAIPDEATASAFATFVEPLQKALFSNEAQAATLAALRDALLPRLISGQLRVSQ